MEILVYKCNICNITYKTNSGLWKHNLKHHKLNNNINKLICKNCNKEFSYSHNRLRHEKYNFFKKIIFYLLNKKK
jgi:transcription elongation factor Elf1